MYPDDAALPEISEMKEKLAGASELVNSYQSEISSGGTLT